MQVLIKLVIGKNKVKNVSILCAIQLIFELVHLLAKWFNN